MFWLRIGLGVVGLVALVLIVRHVGPDVIFATLQPALRWLPVLCALELGRAACEAVASYLAFGKLARKIPLLTLFRANLIGQSVASLAPAPRVVNEGIKVGLLGPYVGVAPAVSVGFVNQAATLSSVGLFSIPCGIAIFALEGPSVWFWAALIHSIVLLTNAFALRVFTKAERPGKWLAKHFPRFEDRIAAFRAHAKEVDLLALGPTGAFLLNRCFQVAQYWVAARAVGIDAGFLRALAAQGVNLVSAAVGVLVPGGFGTTDGAFTLAANLLGTTVQRGVALALLMRCVQLIWLLVGAGLLLAAPVKSGPLEDVA